MTSPLLAVDDSKTMRKVLEITFAGEESRAILAATPEEAVAKLRSDRPAIALIDATLGETSGYDLCLQMKSENPELGVIILSSKQHPYDRPRGAAAGADDFIDKPFDTQALLDKIAALGQKLAAGPAARPAARASGIPVPLAAAAPAASRAPAPPAAAAAPRPQAPSFVAAGSSPGTSVSATPAKFVAPASPTPAVVTATAAVDSSFEAKLTGLGLTPEQLAGVMALSREVVEQVVWEVVPILAETMIREEIQRLTSE